MRSSRSAGSRRSPGPGGGLCPGGAQGRCDARRLAGFTAEGVVFIGRAQEKNKVFRTERRRDREGKTYPWITRSTGVINQFSFYCADAAFGPFFLKFAATSPTTPSCASTATTGPSGRPPRPGSASGLDNGFAAAEDPAALQQIWTGWPGQIDGSCASGWPGCHTHSAQRTGPPGTAMTSRSCRPSFPSPRCWTAGLRADLLRPGDSRQPRYRPPRPDQPGLRPADHDAKARKPRPAGSAPGSSPTGSPQACTSTTRTPRSSSTTIAT